MYSKPRNTGEPSEEIESEADFAKPFDISLLDNAVEFRQCNAKRTRVILLSLCQSLKRRVQSVGAYRKKTAKTQVCPATACFRDDLNRLHFEPYHPAEEKKVHGVFQLLHGATNFYQNDQISEARNRLQKIFEDVMNLDDKLFKSPKPDGLHAVNRGKAIFLEDDVSCSIKHGTILLDSSNSGNQFYASLLNVLGAFAMVISEFQMAQKIFSKLLDWHKVSTVHLTSHPRDLGAAFNNTGCLAIIMGELSKAKDSFEKSLEQFELERRCRPSSSLDAKLIAVKSNISQVYFRSRDFGEAFEQQGELVEECKAKEIQELPLQVVFTVLNNRAIFYTTLANFQMAEEELKWLSSYLFKMNRDECDLLVNFVSLHLSEVLLLQGKSKDAENQFCLETSTFTGFIDLLPMLGGLHMNVRIAAFEKMLDVIVLKGEMQVASQLLEKAVNILKQNFGPDHFNVALLIYRQGKILSLIGKITSSLEKMKSTIDILRKSFGKDHPLLLKCYLSVADLAFRLECWDESFLYCEMAMVNIEAIYQVSFVDQLYTTYLEITSNTETSRRDAIQGDKIEGLVAEHGQVFAMLLSKLVLPKVDRVPPRSKVKGKQPHTRKIRRFQSSEFSLMIGEKHSRDFLLTGQTLLRQGKRKEAIAFFQQAAKYSAAYQLAQGYPNGWMARLYNTILKIRLERHGFGSYNDLSNYLEELVQINERRIANDISKDAPVVTTDCDLTLKLVLTFLIMLSVELEAIEITFAAYDLYSKLFQDNESKFFFLNDQVQVYASRILMTCNGKTASQDILLVSAVSLNENEADRSKTDKQLFRSVASRRNVPTNGFLITLMSSTFRDIGELQELEREISLSLHECFRLKCFGSGADSTSRVIVDLTSKANTTNPMMRCNRISLLSLCLSDELLTETHHEGNVCQISSTACQKITRSTFKDEQTTKFMYSQTVLGVLENYRSKICSLSVQGQCLRLTIREPVKACLVLQYHGRCIQQVFQLVKTTSREESSARGLPGHMYREEEDIANEIDEFSMADMHMNLLAKQYQVPCQTNVLYYHDPLDNTGSSVKADDYIPECLSGVTEISKQLKQFCRLRRDEFEGDHYAMVVDANDPEDCSSDLTCSQLHHGHFERDFQSATFPPKRDIRSQSLTLRDPESAGQWEQEEALTSEAECDENILGRVIFQKARHSRRIRLAELHHHLKKTEVSESSLVIEQKRFPLILKGKDDYVTKDQITTETRQMNNPLQSSTYSQQGSSRNENQHSSPTSEITSETSSLADKKVTTCSCELNASTLVPVSGSGRFIIEQDEKSNSALFINLQDQTDREIHINCSMKDKNCTSKRKHEDFESLRNPTNDSQGTDTTENNDRIVRCIPVTKKTDSKWGNGAKARGKDHEEISKIAPAKEKTFSPDVIGVESTTERAADTSNLRISATEKGENHENHVESKTDFDKKVDRKEDEKCISTMCSSKDFDEDRKATQGRVNFENRSSQIGIRTMRGSESGSLTTDKHQGPADHSETDINSSTTTKSFGGARPKILPKGTRKDRFVRFGANDSSLCYRKNKTSRTGLDAGFIARHADDKDRLSFLLPGYENKDALKVPDNHVYDGLCTSSSVCGKWLNREYLPSDKRFLHCNYDAADLRPFPAKDTFEDRGGVQNISRSLVSHEENVPDERKGGKFLRAVTNGNCSLLKSYKEEGLENLTQTKQFEDSTDCSIIAMFTGCGSRDARDDMETIANEYSREMETSDCIPVYPETVSKDLPHTEKLSTLLGSFQQTLTKTIRLVASTNANVHRPDRELQSVEKIGIQEETTRSTEREPVIAAGVDEPRRRRESIQATNPTLQAEPKPIATPVQESPRAVCSHYQRRCLVSFPCCGKFYPCHRCHNESDCSEDQARAINATHIRCAICSHEQEIDETSQKCGSCKATMSEYFCVTCKHFTSVDKNPFHCEKCGICRIHRDRSFHCDVCNVCLDKRLEGKHKCRPDSGHDECCICLEDAFSGCQILPCSHKVHKDCAIAMIQNGVRTCPICRHPLFGQLQNNSQH